MGLQLAQASATAGVPIRTARRWLAAYRSGGPAALDPASRSDRGRRRIPVEVVELVEGLALRRPAAIGWRHPPASRRVAAERSLSAPSYTTVRETVAGLDPGLVTLDPTVPRRIATGSRWSTGASPRDRMNCGRPITPNST